MAPLNYILYGRFHIRRTLCKMSHSLSGTVKMPVHFPSCAFLHTLFMHSYPANVCEVRTRCSHTQDNRIKELSYKRWHHFKNHCLPFSFLILITSYSTWERNSLSCLELYSIISYFQYFYSVVANDLKSLRINFIICTQYNIICMNNNY